MGSLWIVENDKLLCRVLARWLSGAGFVVRTFTSTYDADAALAAGGPPDGLLIDQRFPGGESGLDLVDRRRAQLQRTHIALLTGCHEADVTHRASALSVVFLLKPAPPVAFEPFISATHARALTRLAGGLSEHAAAATVGFSRRHVLSKREIEVLVLFVQGLGTKEIALELELRPDTVEKHFGSILKRAHLGDRQEILRELLLDSP